MLSSKDQLTELIRELESRNYIFATDPLVITENLKHESAKPLDKLHRRAERIDSNGKLSLALQKIDARIKAFIFLLTLIYTASGFVGLFALLSANVVNFFYILVCLLGLHTLMLIGWLVFSLFSRNNKPTLFASLVSPSQLIRSKDEVTQSAIALYETQLQHAGMRWYLGKISHQLWLATLCGMLLSLVVLLMVRDVTFSWQSTLLSADTIATLVGWMSWLPSLVGFPTPTPDQIIHSQQFAHSLSYDATSVGVTQNTAPVSSYEWAMLLIGSLLMYGIVPRAIVWLFCTLLFHSKKMHIDLKQVYYQKIMDFWSRKITDDNDFTEQVTPITTQVSISDGAKLAVLLEYPHHNPYWYRITQSNPNSDSQTQNIQDFGMVDEREQMVKLLEQLDAQEQQVLLGIHASALPDRGTMRKLDKIANHAKQGMVVLLLDDSEDNNAVTTSNPSEEQQTRLQQWQQALSKRQIALLTESPQNQQGM